MEDAIADRKRVGFTADDARVVAEPHLLAVNTDGDMILRVYQVVPMEDWRDYRLAHLADIEIIDERFEDPREGYDPLATGLLWVIYRL